MSTHFSSRAGVHHYLSMAKGVFESELSGEMVKLKRYFYALRPVLAAKWIADMKSVPPMEFKSLSVLMPDRISALVNELISIKLQADESFIIERKSEINAFIEESIRYCEARVPAGKNSDNDVELNKLFKKSIV